MESVNSNYTFLNLIKEHQILIPVIQRDYVQGRSNEEVNELRINFIKDIINTLKLKEGNLSLGFVYGKIIDADYKEKKRKNKEVVEGILESLKDYAKHIDEEISFNINWNSKISENDGISISKFIPLDGQQRLTTLFLFHWYIIHRLPLKKEEYAFLLKGFKYHTRKQTQEFIDTITSLDFEFNEGNFRDYIEKRTWFLHQWLYDPSVVAMLNTIETIHNFLKNESDIELQELLNELHSSKINFDFLDLVELNQTDEIYVKMNARGKQLSDFEHFKAWIQGHIKQNPNDFSLNDSAWEAKLDIEWLDLFWKDNIVGDVDDSMLRFFQVVGFSKNIVKNETEFSKILYQKIKSTPFKNRYLTTEENSELFDQEVLNHIFSVLTFLKSDNINQYNYSISKVLNHDYDLRTKILIGDNLERLSQNDEIILHAILQYGIRSVELRKSFDSENFEQWLRIIRNLASNTFIQGIENYTDALKSLTKISNYCHNIENEIFDNDLNIEFFLGDQRREEKLKIEKFRISDKWRELINKFELHQYFNGQIGFFFDIMEENEHNDIILFEKIGNRLCYLFKDILEKDYSLLQATLLSIGDYTIKKGGKSYFIDKRHSDLRSRFDNWRKVFDKKNSYDNRVPFNFLKILVRDDRELNEIRKSFNTVDDWRYIFVKNKSLITYCSEYTFDYVSECNIQLLKNTTYTGKSIDAILYYIFKEIDKKENHFKIEIKEINGAKRAGNQSLIFITMDFNSIIKVSLDFTQTDILFKLVTEISDSCENKNDIEMHLNEVFTEKSEEIGYSLKMNATEYIGNQAEILNKIILNLSDLNHFIL